jgi:hypothetical protein
VSRLRLLLVLLGAAAAGLAVGLAVLSVGDELPPVDRNAEGRALWQRTSISPRVHLFAEPVTAEAEFLADPGRIDPSSLQLVARFAPYTQISAARTETQAGDLVRILFRFRLSCMRTDCVPTEEKQEIQFETARVGYGPREASGVRTQDVVAWPAFEVASRLRASDVDRARWRAELSELPVTSFRASPGVLGAAFLGSSALLALLAGALVASQLRWRLRDAEEDDEQPQLTPVERALVGVLASSANGAGPQQRKSLERLARELAADGRIELAGRARRLAWSPRQASRAEVEALAADVRAVMEEER